MPFDEKDYTPKMGKKEEILFWICVPFLVLFVFLFAIPVFIHHFFWRHVFKKKGLSLWEWFEQDEMSMFGMDDYDNEDEKMFHGTPSEHFKKDKKPDE